VKEEEINDLDIDVGDDKEKKNPMFGSVLNMKVDIEAEPKASM